MKWNILSLSILIILVGCNNIHSPALTTSNHAITVYDLLINPKNIPYNNSVLTLEAKFRVNVICAGPSLGCKTNCDATCIYYPVLYGDDNLSSQLTLGRTYGTDGYLRIHISRQPSKSKDEVINSVNCGQSLSNNATHLITGKYIVNNQVGENGVPFTTSEFDIYNCTELN